MATAPASTTTDRVQAVRPVSWSSWIDGLVNLTKWPIAMLALLASPLLFWALVHLAGRMIVAPSFSLLPFAGGALAFALMWRRWLGRGRWGRFLIALEHESTHALFALLTFHPIVGFRASLGRGGEVRFIGRGNWLITAAPYFFPTAAVLLFVVAFFLPFAALPWQSFLLGVALAYHLISTRREVHRDQTDLRLLGPAFCWMFLPAANMAVIGLLVSFAHLGGDGPAVWWAGFREPIEQLLAWWAPT